MGIRRKLRKPGITWWIASAFMVSVTFVPAMAQVHIQETVSISPFQQKRLSIATVNTHTLRVRFNWTTQDSGKLEIHNVYLYDNYEFDTTVYSGSGSITIVIHGLKPNQYQILPDLYWNYSSQAPYSYYIYLDDSLVDSSSGTAQVGDWHNAWYFEDAATFTTPYVSKFSFSVGTNEFMSGDSTGMALASVYDTSNTVWSPHTEPVTLTVISGSRFVSFHKTDPQTGMVTDLGSSVTTFGDEIGEYSLVADGAVPDSTGDWVTVEAESNGMTETDSAEVFAGLDHFAVHPSPDTIEDSASSTIYVDAEDVYNQSIYYDGYVNIYTSPSQYGHLYYFLPSAAMKAKHPGRNAHEVSGAARETGTPGIAGNMQSVKLTSATEDSTEVPFWYANAGLVYYSADGTPTDTNTTINFTVDAVDKPTLTGKGTLVVKGGSPTLVVVYPTDELNDEKDITKDPKMPDITPQARLENYNGGTVNFEWNLRVQWEGPDGRRFDDSFHGNKSAQNSNVSSWPVDWNKMIRGGDEITLDVTATAGGKAYHETVNHGFKIVGLNPSKSAIKSAITESDPLAIEVIIFKESSWRQFKKNRDFPVWGYPNGYGLMQIDNSPAATDEQVWDWKANLAGGEAHFDSAKTSALALPARYRARTKLDPSDKEYLPIGYQNATDFSTNEQMLKETFKEYNSGNKYPYWRWKSYKPFDPSSGGKWIRRGDKENYADQAWNLYTNPKGSWNQ